ncbi:hypothetical protein Naga_100100g10 [Nannochloropsis gaditana]|uniref:Transmembrane protein n=1 Tax=Nannochloropsis gaditana TaxID=72520 RepID=W7U3X8_9STRA|nr:hypothetical protein Naga_100100g10 [Nannochloropsis gaditana]
MKAASTPLSFNLPLFTSPSPFCDSSNDNAIFVCQHRKDEKGMSRATEMRSPRQFFPAVGICSTLFSIFRISEGQYPRSVTFYVSCPSACGFCAIKVVCVTNRQRQIDRQEDSEGGRKQWQRRSCVGSAVCLMSVSFSLPTICITCCCVIVLYSVTVFVLHRQRWCRKRGASSSI